MPRKFNTIEEFRVHVQAKAAEDGEFRSRLLADPKSVVEDELGMSLPDELNVRVHEENSTTAHLVIPPSAALAEADMTAVAGGWWGGSWQPHIS